MKYYIDKVLEDPRRNLRLFGDLGRESQEWQASYAKKQGTFKSLK